VQPMHTRTGLSDVFCGHPTARILLLGCRLPPPPASLTPPPPLAPPLPLPLPPGMCKRTLAADAPALPEVVLPPRQRERFAAHGCHPSELSDQCYQIIVPSC
jgi:hypothetical protein